MKNNTEKRGFTLVELLVVIAILSVLAALLLPSLQNALEMGRKVDCSNHVRQLMIMAAGYENDYQKMLPGYVTQPGRGGENGGWTYAELLRRTGMLDTNILMQTWSNPTSATINRILRPKSVILCPNGIVTGTGGAQGGGEVGNVYYGNYPAFTEELVDVLDGLNNVPSYEPTLRQSTIARSFGVSGGFDYYTKNDRNHGITYRWQNLTGNWDRRINSTPTNASRRLYFIEARDYLVYATSFREPTYGTYNATTMRCPHLDSALYSCYDGHVGSISRAAMEYAAGNQARAIEAAADHFEW